MKTQVRVVIDSNEAAQHPEMIAAFDTHPEVKSWKVAPLSVGDILIESVVFERKTPSDFASR